MVRKAGTSGPQRTRAAPTGGAEPRKKAGSASSAEQVGFRDDDLWQRPAQPRRARGDARARMRRMAVSSGLAKSINRTFLSVGTDYSHSRKYKKGDAARHLDWKAIAKTDKLYTKVFTEEPDPIVMMVIPNDVWKNRSVHERERRRHFEQVTALMAFSSEHYKTDFGVMVYSDQTDFFQVAEGKRPGGTDSVLDNLAELGSAQEDAAASDAALVGAELKSLRGRKAILMYCTDRPDDPIPDEVCALAKDHELIRVSVSPDRTSMAQPAMLQVMNSALSKKEKAVAQRKSVGGVYDELVAQRLLDRQPVESDEIDTMALNVNEPLANQMSFFFDNRRR